MTLAGARRSVNGEHVLDATVVGLDADQAEAEVDGGVADQVVHVVGPRPGRR